MRAQGLFVCCAVLTMMAVTPPVGAQDTASHAPKANHRYRISGVVTDVERQPLAQVEIATVDSAGEKGRRTMTDEQGRFDLGQFEEGSVAVTARRLGYEQLLMQVELGGGDQSGRIDIVLLDKPAELENVDVTAAAPPTKLRGFYERSRQKRSFGRFFDEQRIRQLNPRLASELLRSVPGVRLSSNQSGGNTIRIRGCQPMVWLDDQRVPGAELDDLIVPSEIAAIEFYASNAGIPAQYLDRGNRLCGLILVWTKSG